MHGAHGLARGLVRLGPPTGEHQVGAYPRQALGNRVLHRESCETSGSPSIWDALVQRGHGVGEHRIARLMRVEGILVKTVKPLRATTPSNHRWPVADNTLVRQFTGEPSNRVWAEDFTDVWTTEGGIYLALVLDCYSRTVIDWAMGHRMTVDLTEQARTKAGPNRKPTAGLLHRSDRGRQYAATAYQPLLTTQGMTGSMSRRGTGWARPTWRASSGH